MRNRILALAAAILILLTGCHMIPAPPATSTESISTIRFFFIIFSLLLLLSYMIFLPAP